MTTLTVKYNPDDYKIFRFKDHFVFGFASDIGTRTGNATANFIEEAGDALLEAINLIPRGIKAVVKAFDDPRVVTIALTAIALLTVSFFFYPTLTYTVTKAACIAIAETLPHIPLWAVRFGAYTITSATVLGIGIRALGRAMNAHLMKAFYELPNYNGNPGYLSAEEIAHLRRAV